MNEKEKSPDAGMRPVQGNGGDYDSEQGKDTTNPVENQTFSGGNSSPDGQQDEDTMNVDDYIIELTADIPKPYVALRHGDAVIATLGNLSLIIGKAKSRKTFFTTILSTAACRFGGLYGYRSELPASKSKIVVFDTEQSPYHAQLVLKRIERLGANMDDIIMYGLRPLDPIDRRNVIEHVLYTRDDIGIVVIDGVRDLIFDINDPQDATELATYLLKWSYERNIHIVNVLHQNKNDNNARGHVGSELTNKSETVLSVSKADGDDTVSVVTAEYCRGIEPADFYFEIDENGLPVEAAHAEIRTAAKTKSFDIRDVPEDETFAMFAKIFNGNEMSYAELIRQTKYHFKDTFGKGIGDNKARDLLTHAKAKGWISQEGEKKPYRLGSTDEKLPVTSDLPF